MYRITGQQIQNKEVEGVSSFWQQESKNCIALNKILQKREDKESFFVRMRRGKKRAGAIQSVAPTVAPGYGWSESKNWELEAAAAALFP